jgi:hypothetical protein
MHELDFPIVELLSGHKRAEHRYEKRLKSCSSSAIGVSYKEQRKYSGARIIVPYHHITGFGTAGSASQERVNSGEARFVMPFLGGTCDT